MHALTTIDEALNDLARDSKAQIALDASRHDTSECSPARLCGLRHGDFGKLGVGTRVLGRM